MKILVAVKRVVDAKIKVRPLPDHSGVDVKLAKMAMNPFDEIAIEKAVTLREAGVADEVVAVTVGPLKAVDTLRVAMAIGADRAVHVRTDESLEPLAVAKVLRAVVEREKPDLVLLGKQAIDDDANQTGQMLSALCDMPLATFAMEAYKDDPCTVFEMKGDANNYSILEEELGRKMHKAIAIIQFKLEGQLIRRHKEFHMEKRCLLHRIDPKKGTITLPDGKEYPLTDTYFPTIDWKKPYELTTEEKDVMDRLDSAFRNCEKLQNHVRLLLDKGGLYKTYNGNLLFHGSIPLNEDGSLKEVQIYGKTYKGKELYDVLETYVRRAFFSVNEDEKRKGRDIMWYIWAAPNSPLFGKDKMTTFERYFIKDKETHKETKNAYYHLLENEEVVDELLREFGLDPEKGHIINGHVPVHQSEGESPVKCNGKVLVIDGGFSRPYQKVTGIAGYTLVYNSYGLILSAHEPFTSAEEAVAKEQDIVSNRVAVHYNNKRTLVGDTDTGTALKERISELIQLLEAYRKGIIKEKK